MNNNKKKVLALVLIAIILILAGLAIFITIQLQKAQVPTAPTSRPRATEWYGSESCNLSFTVAAATGTPTPTGAPNPCNGDCGSDSNCQTGLICYDAGVAGKHCRNSQNPTSETCAAPTTTPTATPTTSPTGTPPPKADQPLAGTATGTIAPTATGTVAATVTARVTAAPTGAKLPEAGILNLPGAAAFGGGLLLTILGILFAL